MTTLYRRQPRWDEFAELAAVLQLGQPASALHWVPGPREGSDDPRGLAVGDSAGGLHLVSPGGQLLAQIHTGAPLSG